MSSYCFNILLAIKALEGKQNSVPVFEEVLLIVADSETEACKLAENYGRQKEMLDDKLTLCGLPARREFLGIRKAAEVEELEGVAFPNLLEPVIELTSSYFEVDSKKELALLKAGKTAVVRYVDDDEPEIPRSLVEKVR